MTDGLSGDLKMKRRIAECLRQQGSALSLERKVSMGRCTYLSGAATDFPEDISGKS